MSEVGSLYLKINMRQFSESYAMGRIVVVMKSVFELNI